MRLATSQLSETNYLACSCFESSARLVPVVAGAGPQDSPSQTEDFYEQTFERRGSRLGSQKTWRWLLYDCVGVCTVVVLPGPLRSLQVDTGSPGISTCKSNTVPEAKSEGCRCFVVRIFTRCCTYQNEIARVLCRRPARTLQPVRSP